MGMHTPPLEDVSDTKHTRQSKIAVGARGNTFFLRHASQACWTCFRFTGSPPRLGSDATNLTLRDDADMSECSRSDALTEYNNCCAHVSVCRPSAGTIMHIGLEFGSEEAPHCNLAKGRQQHQTLFSRVMARRTCGAAQPEQKDERRIPISCNE